MESVLRAIVTYLVIFVLFRISGKRTLKETTPFDLVLILLISEATQEALINMDRSLTNAFLLISTLIAIDMIFSYIKIKFKKADKIIDGVPMLLVSNGKELKEAMTIARLDTEDILEAAREMQGLAKLEEIKFAVLENNGTITIIPREKNN